MRFTDAHQQHYESAVVGHLTKYEQYQAIFGYDVDDRGETSSVSFWIFEVEAWEAGVINQYLIRDSVSMEWTPYLDETDPIADGFIKWDGCHEFSLTEDGLHFCDVADSAKFFEVLTLTLTKALEIVYRGREDASYMQTALGKK